MKYVVVTGEVVSGLCKGVTASSIGVLLKDCRYRATSIKIGALVAPPRGSAFRRRMQELGLPADPYLNIDAGTMSPFEQYRC